MLPVMTRDDAPAGDAPRRTLTVNCPQCQQPAEFSPANRWRPFCSQRCRMIDLGAWANDKYVVPGRPIEGDDDLSAIDGLPDTLN